MSFAPRLAFRASRPLRAQPFAGSGGSKEKDGGFLRRGAKRDPELFVRKDCICRALD